MTGARLRIERCGPLTSLQDRGRTAWLRFGVPRSGPVDRLAFEAARRALGAPADWTAIELSRGGITLVCEAGASDFVVTGRGFEATVDGARLGAWTIGRLQPGERLDVRSAGANWGYLGFAGRIDVRAWLGSTATHAPSGLGGGTVVAGTSLDVEHEWQVRARPIPAPADDAPIAIARAVLGPQEHAFAVVAHDVLRHEPFRATSRFDRMGMVLDGPLLRPLRVDMASAPVTRGALQIDGEGRATLLLADHQTTGGYPRIATLIARDADRVAQLPPASAFRIALLTPAEAITLHRAEAARDEAWLCALVHGEPLHARLASANLISGVNSDPD